MLGARRLGRRRHRRGPGRHRPPGLAGQTLLDRGPADSLLTGARPGADRTDRDGPATLLGPAAHDATPRTAPNGTPGGTTAPAARPDGGLSVYLIDPDGLASPVLLTTETHAASLRACDLSHDGRFALLRRGPRGRREAVVRRTADAATTFALPVADGDPWIGRFSPDGRSLWLRSNADREYAALLAVALDADGRPEGTSVAAERDGTDLELLALAHDGRTASLAWNVQGASELELVETFPTGHTSDDTGPARSLPVPHEVVTRVTAAGAGRLLLALSGSQRRPGVWWAHEGVSVLRTPWSARDEDAVPPGRPPVRPVPLRLTARDGLPLSGWYYRAPGRAPDEPAPCVIHLHGGPEEQERPVFNPLYHELTGRGLDVFAPRRPGIPGTRPVVRRRGPGRRPLRRVRRRRGLRGPRGHRGPRRSDAAGGHGPLVRRLSDVRLPRVAPGSLPHRGRRLRHVGLPGLLRRYGALDRGVRRAQVRPPGARPRAAARAVTDEPYRSAAGAAARRPRRTRHQRATGESQRFVRAARERGIQAELLTLRDEGHDFLRADNRRLFRRAAADWMERHLQA
ncbi:hypothetical protein GCM10020295_79820 [Streptomyces cinereospinus]